MYGDIPYTSDASSELIHVRKIENKKSDSRIKSIQIKNKTTKT